MPVYNRRYLRQKLGQSFLRDTIVSTTTGSWGATASLTIYDVTQADLTLWSEDMYKRAVVRHLTTGSYLQDARVASFNTGSGAFHCLVAARSAVPSGADFEVHTLLPPNEKDLVLTDVAGRLRFKKELAITSVEGGHIYSLGPEVVDVLDARILTHPVGSKNESPLSWWKMVVTGSGQELRIHPATSQSQQLILEAMTTGSLGVLDSSTIDLPDEFWLLTGAASQCYWLLETRGPGQEVSMFKDRRREMSRAFNALSAAYVPPTNKKMQHQEWNG